MEAALKKVESSEFKKPKIQSILKSLDAVVEKASEIRDTALFKNPELREALYIVENFLKYKKRICYGGMAINAHLPAAEQFYDFSKNLPDYDFFTPDDQGDIKLLMHKLEAANMPHVEAKLGIHKGTTKIYVNFNAVADITLIEPKLYEILYNRAYTYKGILYADANFLRMSMYLELSRPMGEVERWNKVYSRLYLFNKFVPFLTEGCRRSPITMLTANQRNACLDFCTNNSMIYAGADLERFYKNPGSKAWLKNSKNPLIAYSSNMYEDIITLKSILESLSDSHKLKLYKWSSQGEFTPMIFGLISGNKIIVLLIDLKYCISYNTVEYKNNTVLHVASLDTLITLYFTLAYIRGLEGLARTSFKCMANHLVKVSTNTRDASNTGPLDPFPLTCMGYQPTKQSLLLAKKLRIKEFREKEKRKNITRKIKH